MKNMLDRSEIEILEILDAAVERESVVEEIDRIISRVESALRQRPGDSLAWEPIPLEVFGSRLPEAIRSSWVFILRADAATGAERHPNSRQRMMSYRGSGDFQTGKEGDWRSHFLKSDKSAPLEERWISIPPGVWHQGVARRENWVVVSFHTAAEDELIEERPDTDTSGAFRRRKYIPNR